MNNMDIESFASKSIHHGNLQPIILTVYGRDTCIEIRKLENTRIKIQRKEAGLTMKTLDIPTFASENMHHIKLQSIISTLYGRDTWIEIRNLEKIRIKIQRREARLKINIVNIITFAYENLHHRNLQYIIFTLYERDTWIEICNLKKTRIKIQRREAGRKTKTVDILSFTSRNIHHRNFQSIIVILYERDTWIAILNL